MPVDGARKDPVTEHFADGRPARPLIRQLVEEGMTSILVTHEMGFAREIADQVYFTDKGVIVEHGSPEQMFDQPQAQRTRDFLEQVL